MKNLLISPITQRWCDKKLLNAAKETALYSIAKKGDVPPIIVELEKKPLTEGEVPRPDFIDVSKQDIGGVASYFPTPPGYGRLFPWPSEMVRCTTDIQCELIAKGLDAVIVNQITSHTKPADRVRFKRCLTVKNLYDAMMKMPQSEELCEDSDGFHYICVTSKKRIEKGKLSDGARWEDIELYGDALYRDEYPGEYGRLKLFNGKDRAMYIVFIATLNDQMMHALLFGADALTVTPLEHNLHAIFRRTPPNGNISMPPSVDIGYQMRFGSAADPARCVVLEAERRVE